MIVIVDSRATIFTKIQQLDLGLPLWRVSVTGRLETIDRAELGIIAAYQGDTWDHVPIGRGNFGLVVVTERYSELEAVTAIDQGLLGYLNANAEPAAMRRAILGVLRGEPGFARAAFGDWLRRQRTCVAAHQGAGALTERQRQVVALVAQGLADKEIAERLGIATATAQKHVTNILERLRVTNRAAAVASTCGLRMGLQMAVRQPRPGVAVARGALYPLALHARTA